MFRRTVSLLIIVGMLASQLAAVPHAHGATSEEAKRKHDATPHFHWFGHCSNCKSHSHDHGKHCHQHEHPTSEDRPTERKESQPVGDTMDHNADAIYVVGGTTLTVGSATQQAAVQSVLAALQMPIATSIVAVEVVIPAERTWRPPDQVLDDSDAYLTLRTLRI